MLTASGRLYRLSDKSATRITTVGVRENHQKVAPRPTLNASTSQPTTAPTLAGQVNDDETDQHLVLLNIHEEDKYALFLWDQGKLRVLDVLDEKKQNVEPFVTSKDVDKKVTTAVEAMMNLIAKADQEGVTAEKEEQRKRQAEETAQPPRIKLLQEYLDE